MNRLELLAKVRDAAGRYGAKVKLASSLEYTRSTIHEKLKRNDGFTDEELQKAAALLLGGVPEDYLEGAKAAGALAEKPETYRAEELTEEFVLIPRYDVAASARPGALADRKLVIDHMAFRSDWVRRTLRVMPENLVLITAIGDSMEPTIRAGDLLLVDTGIDEFIDDAIYVMSLDEHLVVKRVQRFFGGPVTIKSDNERAYVEQTLTAGEAGQIRVAGRVRWIGRLI